jgi:hypothetical protein
MTSQEATGRQIATWFNAESDEAAVTLVEPAAAMSAARSTSRIATPTYRAMAIPSPRSEFENLFYEGLTITRLRQRGGNRVFTALRCSSWPSRDDPAHHGELLDPSLPWCRRVIQKMTPLVMVRGTDPPT